LPGRNLPSQASPSLRQASLCARGFDPAAGPLLGELDYEHVSVLPRSDCNDAERPSPAERDLLARTPVRYGRMQRRRFGRCPVRALELEKETCPFGSPFRFDGRGRTARRAYLVIERGHALGSPRPLCEIRWGRHGNQPDLDKSRFTGAACSRAKCGLSTQLRGIAAEASATAVSRNSTSNFLGGCFAYFGPSTSVEKA
jgi:hypothetical protein